MRTLKIVTIVLALTGTLFAADPLDTIVGKVGEDIIMKSEVERQVQLYRLQA
ncbi:molecular chaperone SurA, partial [bacterium]|nr:molecular chaperone SurA [bacterium]